MGISFLAGVNAGLGKENAQAYTIHPMDFVQQHLDTQSHFRSEVPTPTYNPHLEELIDHQSSPPAYNPHLEDIIRSDRDDIIVA